MPGGPQPPGHGESDTAEGTHRAGALHCGPRGSFMMGCDSFVKCASPSFSSAVAVVTLRWDLGLGREHGPAAFSLWCVTCPPG